MTETMYIYESELCRLAYEASKYPDCETGGDLYGLWTADGKPVVYLATGPGKNAVCEKSQYRMDISYEKNCEKILFDYFGIHYLGDWHSHNNLQFYQPSSGDKQRIKQLLSKNRNVAHMAEILVNHFDYNRKEIITAFIYKKTSSMLNANIKCVKTKVSPVREKLSKISEKNQFNLIEKALPIQQLILELPEQSMEKNNVYHTQVTALNRKNSIAINLER